MSELNKIFDVKSREARRKILDNYPISANDKNEILNKIGNSSGREGGETRYFKIKEGVNLGSYEAAGIEYMQYYNCFTLKLIDQNGNTIITQGYRSMFIGSYDTALAFSFTPGIVPIYNDLNEENKKLIDVKYCNTIEELVDFVTNSGGQGDAQVSINPLFYAECEISEEEYYQIPTKTFNVAIASTAYTGSEVLGDAPYIIKTYEYIPGMTFDKWFDSKYNIDNIKPFMVNGQIEQGKVSASFLTDNDGYGCTIYGYSGVGIEFYYAVDGYFYDRDVNTPNGKQTCQLIITGM